MEYLTAIGVGFFVIAFIAYMGSKNYKGNSYTTKGDWIRRDRTMRQTRVIMIISVIVAVVGAVYLIIDKVG